MLVAQDDDDGRGSHDEHAISSDDGDGDGDKDVEDGPYAYVARLIGLGCLAHFGTVWDPRFSREKIP